MRSEPLKRNYLIFIIYCSLSSSLSDYLVLSALLLKVFQHQDSHHLETVFASQMPKLSVLHLQGRVYFLIEQRATKKWVVTASQRGRPGPIEADLQHQEQQRQHAAPPPSPFPWRRTTSNSKTLIFIEEVKPFHLNAEKVALTESGKQRRRKKPTQNRGAIKPRGGRGPRPRGHSAAPDPVEGSGVRPAAEKSRRSGQPGTQSGERREGRHGGWRGGALGAVGLCVQSGPG